LDGRLWGPCLLSSLISLSSPIVDFPRLAFFFPPGSSLDFFPPTPSGTTPMHFYTPNFLNDLQCLRLFPCFFFFLGWLVSVFFQRSFPFPHRLASSTLYPAPISQPCFFFDLWHSRYERFFFPPYCPSHQPHSPLSLPVFRLSFCGPMGLFDFRGDPNSRPIPSFLV